MADTTRVTLTFVLLLAYTASGFLLGWLNGKSAGHRKGWSDCIDFIKKRVEELKGEDDHTG